MSPPSSVPPAARSPVAPATAECAFFALAETIVGAGAIVTLPGSPLRHHLVGHFAWLGSNRFFWFTAHGDTVEDGHVVDFDEARCLPGDRIAFYRANQLVATLAPIPQAGVEDPDDYLIAWQLWYGVSPRRRGLIRAALGRFLEPDSDAAVDSPPPRTEHRGAAGK